MQRDECVWCVASITYHHDVRELHVRLFVGNDKKVGKYTALQIGQALCNNLRDVLGHSGNAYWKDDEDNEIDWTIENV